MEYFGFLSAKDTTRARLPQKSVKWIQIFTSFIDSWTSPVEYTITLQVNTCHQINTIIIMTGTMAQKTMIVELTIFAVYWLLK